MTGKVVHFEIPAADLDRARSFYREVFGWSLTPVPDLDYTMVQTAPTDEAGNPTEPGAINGGMLQRQEPFGGPVVVIDVDDINLAAERIAQHGGTLVRERYAVGPMGFAAYFADPEGNLMGLWESAEQ